MAAIAPSRLTAGLLLAIIASAAAECRADQAHDVLEVVNRVTTALAAGDASEAIAPFDKSFSPYETLKTYFSSLTSAYDVSNEADVVNESDAAEETSLTLDWTLTLQSPDNASSSRRRSTVQMKLRRFGKKWKIVDLSPVQFFNPQP